MDFLKNREKCKGFFKEEDDEKIVLNFWGGQQYYYKSTKTYRMIRSSGIFSNLNVALYAIFIMEYSGYKIENIEFIMYDYYIEKDVYPMVFKFNNNVEINLSEFSDSELDHFCVRNYPTILGLNFIHNTSKKDFNFKITKQIIDKFLTPNENVVKEFENMLLSKHLQKNEYVFVWARKTGKIYETKVPNANKYIEIIYQNKLENEKIIIQSDDKTVIQEFYDLNFNFDRFEEMPFALDESFHQRISHTDDSIFFDNFKMSKDEYFIKMFCVLLLASSAKVVIIYPGNPTTTVPMYRNSFDNCLLFHNDNYIL